MKFSVPNDVLVQELKGELVLLNLNTEEYFGMNTMGTAIWLALKQTTTLEAACEMLLANYEVEQLELRHDVEELVQQLVAHGLLAVS